MSETSTHRNTRTALCRRFRAMALFVSGLAAGMPVLAGNAATMTPQNPDRWLTLPVDQPRSLQQTPQICRGVPLDNFGPSQSAHLNFWQMLIQALRQRGFSTIEVNKLRETFGHLDAAALQGMPEDQLLAALTGRTAAERRQKAAVVRATASEVQACLAALGQASPQLMDRQAPLRSTTTAAPLRPLPTGAGSSLARVSSLTAEHREVLQRSNIHSAVEIANLPVRTIASMLRTSQQEAQKIVLDARSVQRVLDTKYSQTRSLYPARRDDSGDAWSQLIQPDNQCTALVRKTCGPQNQCANTNGCGIAVELLRRFNQGGRDGPMALDACWASLSDETVFPPCGAAR